jgi:acyl carrier protein
LTQRAPVTVRLLLAVTEHDTSRAAEQSACRHALRLVTALCGHPGRPRVSTSVSHAHGVSVVAAAIGTRATIGVDLEENRPADPRAGRFFLQPAELAWLDTAPARNDEHLRLWTVKEALFKADPGNDETMLRSYAVAVPAARAGYARRAPDAVFGYGSARLGERHLAVAACLDDIPTERNPMETDNLHPPVSTDAVMNRIAQVLDLPASELSADTPVRSLVRESFMLVELVVDLQEEFGSYFTQAELRTVETVGQLVALLQADREKRADAS